MKNEIDMTQHGISKLYCSLFEGLGWVILMMMKGNSSHSKSYLKDINKFIIVINKKIGSVSDKDKLHDLNVMLNNLELLSNHVQKDIKLDKNINYNLKNVKSNNNSIEYDTTLCGLNKWYESAFSKLGWIILAHNQNNSKRVSQYIHMLHNLHKSIITRHNITNDNDTKNDLMIMKNNIELLLYHSQNDFE